MKKVLTCCATTVLTAVLATSALPATAGILPVPGSSQGPAAAAPAAAGPATAGPATAAPAAGEGKAARAGAGSADGIRDEFARLRCLFFRC